MTSKARKDAATREHHIREIAGWFRSNTTEQMIKYMLDHLKNIAFGGFFIASSALLEGNKTSPGISTFLYFIGIAVLFMNGLVFFQWLARIVPESFLSAVFGSRKLGSDNAVIILFVVGMLYLTAIMAIVTALTALKMS